ncbi:hypothetical protein [Nocardioides sp. BYT-33-1]|uniref:hypothetical protein n=1 Tax=Nocardioides sp. BYT-33-1 TaxID=3416952 RepID=UPI003F53125E
MRDPQRIDDVLAAVAEAWRRNPDLRLGQLIYTAAAEAAAHPLAPCPELFYIEDGELLDALR